MRPYLRLQAKDCQQGGLFQMEPQPSTRERNTLGPDFTYTSRPPGERRLCLTNGRFPGYDSPELATLVSHTERVATWRVASGGRIGMVIGEDAVEGGCAPLRHRGSDLGGSPEAGSPGLGPGAFL